MKGRPQKQGQTSSLTVILLVGLTLFLFVPEIFRLNCFLRQTLGLPCPTCGMSRAFLLLLAGDLKGALTLHPLLPLLFLDLLLAAVVLIRGFWRRRHGLEAFAFLPPKAIRLFVTVNYLLLFGVYLLRLAWLFPHKPPLDWNEAALLPRLWRLLRVLLVP